jgi:hypothetical protein
VVLQTPALKPMKVSSASIDQANDRPNNFGCECYRDVNAEGEFEAYTGKFSGSGV